MTWVKICGMTNLEDALIAVDAGADAVGFVFYEKSPRCVTVETAREIVEKLPESVETVGVIAGESIGRAGDIQAQLNLGAWQVYPLSFKRSANGPQTSESTSFKPNKIYLAFPMSEFVNEEAVT